MKMLVSVLLLNLWFASLVWADSSQCYGIKNADLKNNCLATTRYDKSRCYSIKDSDLKNSCLAQAGSDKSRCYSIKNKDKKQQCLADF